MIFLLLNYKNIILAQRPEHKNATQKSSIKVFKRAFEINLSTRLVGSWVNNGLSVGECLENADIWNSKNNPPLSEREVETNS